MTRKRARSGGQVRMVTGDRRKSHKAFGGGVSRKKRYQHVARPTLEKRPGERGTDEYEDRDDA